MVEPMQAPLDPEDRVARLYRNIRQLLRNVAGDPGTCDGCGAEIYWVTHRTSVRSPYDADRTSHFATCPKASSFRRAR